MRFIGVEFLETNRVVVADTVKARTWYVKGSGINSHRRHFVFLDCFFLSDLFFPLLSVIKKMKSYLFLKNNVQKKAKFTPLPPSSFVLKLEPNFIHWSGVRSTSQREKESKKSTTSLITEHQWEYVNNGPTGRSRGSSKNTDVERTPLREWVCLCAANRSKV